MQFDELCALVGALRDRVADLEAKEAARAERDAKTQVITSGLRGDWRTLDGKPISFNVSVAGAEGNREIAEIAAAAVKRGLAQGGIVAPGNYLIGEAGPEAIMPKAVWPKY